MSQDKEQDQWERGFLIAWAVWLAAYFLLGEESTSNSDPGFFARTVDRVDQDYSSRIVSQHVWSNGAWAQLCRLRVELLLHP